ncbi:MAG: hypothetical protein A3G34_01225 [Candidatus Lindowbacteria bacterium RIFCSPLOWO2_12_FULL_62_27]|nr:MAG: hypothetical protein A3G34_01225 [Candidatus Lindowbacteria bacterium RIFCSPLOWO2_12_FULL_62_27]OGH63692.1 MAG: hypothetical protein A3I06_07675 [Candidatus Lindowbacteria bacterium RIFCSPLOWO2_02_FULL_62_12]
MNEGAKSGAWQRWIEISMKGGTLLLMVLLYAFYFTVFCPFALFTRLLSDPLRRRAGGAGSFFVPRSRVTETRETAAHPY